MAQNIVCTGALLVMFGAVLMLTFTNYAWTGKKSVEYPSVAGSVSFVLGWIVVLIGAIAWVWQ